MTHGIICAAQPEAAEAGALALKNGGNAVDAAIAANLCEGVVEPMMNGMGGDLMAQVWDPKTKKLYGYNGSGRSPRGLSYARMKQLLSELPGSPQFIPGAGPLI